MASEKDSLLNRDAAYETVRSQGHPLRTVVILALICFLAGAGVGALALYEAVLLDGWLHGSASRTADPNQPMKSKSKYTATQFISFSINTLGGVAAYGECEGRLVDEEDGLCYLGNDNDLADDLSHRFSIIEEVLSKLKEDALEEAPEVDHRPNVLKIFMLPEFYLRGPQGAYSAKLFQDDGLMVTLADKIDDLVDDEAFEDYLFVLGTIIMAESPYAPETPWNVSSQDIRKGDILYYNVAPVSRGGSKHYENKFMVPKNYISTADFLNRNNGLPDPRESHLTEYDDLDRELLDYLKNERNVTVLNDGILEIDGIRIGIEICLDHRLGRLYHVLQKKSGSEEVDEDKLVDVHLITSAGMAIERGPTPVRSGGVVYLTDGEGSSAACLRSDEGTYDPSAVCRDRHNDGPKGLKHVPVGGKGFSSYVELACCLNPYDAAWKPMMEGFYSVHATQGCAYTMKLHGIDVYDEYDFYPPSIEIYPTIDLPN